MFDRGMKRKLLTTLTWNVLLVFPVVLLPTMANADSEFYGSLHAFAGKVEGVSGINLNSYSSRLGLKGANKLSNNWVLSHKLELGFDSFNDALEGGGVRKLPSGVQIKNTNNNEIEVRNAWLGVKSQLGEFRVGRHVSIYDILDDGQNLLSKVGHALPSSRERTEQLLYVNKSGLMAYSLSYAPFENKSEDRVVSGLFNYVKGSYYAGLGLEKSSGLSLGSKLALGYNKDGLNNDEYSLGLVYDKQIGSSATSLSLSGLYRLGKIYAGVEFGKVLSGNILNQNNTIKFTKDTKNKALELGYQWNKNTKFYIDYSNLGERKETSIAVKYDF